jgi:hypothetical protein
MIEPTGYAVAGRWFGVSASTQHVGVWRKAWQVIRELFLGLITLGLTWGEFDPPRRCVVAVFRRDTGQIMAEFNYTHLSEASMHVPALWERLQTENVFDFCRELGIQFDAVKGGGQDQPQNSDDVWSETRR